MQIRGHRVICVTARKDNEENRKDIGGLMKIPVYFTGGVSKIRFAKENNLRINIWIDDNPEGLVNGYHRKQSN